MEKLTATFKEFKKATDELTEVFRSQAGKRPDSNFTDQLVESAAKVTGSASVFLKQAEELDDSSILKLAFEIEETAQEFFKLSLDCLGSTSPASAFYTAMFMEKQIERHQANLDRFLKD